MMLLEVQLQIGGGGDYEQFFVQLISSLKEEFVTC